MSGGKGIVAKEGVRPKSYHQSGFNGEIGFGLAFLQIGTYAYVVPKEKTRERSLVAGQHFDCSSSAPMAAHEVNFVSNVTRGCHGTIENHSGLPGGGELRSCCPSYSWYKIIFH